MIYIMMICIIPRSPHFTDASDNNYNEKSEVTRNIPNK